jgi:hypothetical protein
MFDQMQQCLDQRNIESLISLLNGWPVFFEQIAVFWAGVWVQPAGQLPIGRFDALN